MLESGGRSKPSSAIAASVRRAWASKPRSLAISIRPGRQALSSGFSSTNRLNSGATSPRRPCSRRMVTLHAVDAGGERPRRSSPPTATTCTSARRARSRPPEWRPHSPSATGRRPSGSSISGPILRLHRNAPAQRRTAPVRRSQERRYGIAPHWSLGARDPPDCRSDRQRANSARLACAGGPQTAPLAGDGRRPETARTIVRRPAGAGHRGGARGRQLGERGRWRVHLAPPHEAWWQGG